MTVILDTAEVHPVLPITAIPGAVVLLVYGELGEFFITPIARDLHRIDLLPSHDRLTLKHVAGGVAVVFPGAVPANVL